MKKSVKKYCVIIGLITLLHNGVASAGLVLTAPPREKPEAGESFYAPIAKQLSAVLGEPVTYRHPGNWHTYSRDMRQGKYDIVFDGPHFAAWRIKNTNHVPVARLPGSLRFVILAHADDDKVNSLRDLVDKSVCGLASPNLGTVLVHSVFHNPVIQPEIRIVKGGMKVVMKKFFAGDCKYAVVRDKMFFGQPAEKQKLAKIIVHSQPLPNQTITVNARIKNDKIRKIRNYMISEAGAKTANQLLTRFSKKKKYFIKADITEFQDLESLLQGVVYGW